MTGAATLVFDIETVPDVAGLRRLHDLPASLADAEVAEMAFTQRRAATGGDFLPHHLHRVVAISCALRDRDIFRVWSLGDLVADEAELIRRFFDGIDRLTPQLVSWNGGGFDLPVLHYRGLINGIAARRYWEQGDDDRDFRFNNYVNRFHTRHIDLMDMLSLWQPRAYAPLDQMAQLCGLPGKFGMSGAGVWAAWQAGDLARIRDYCETDVVNTYLLFLRFQRLRGLLSDEALVAETELVRTRLAATGQEHWIGFVARWGEARC